jgi:hypothetical protein
MVARLFDLYDQKNIPQYYYRHLKSLAVVAWWPSLVIKVG